MCLYAVCLEQQPQMYSSVFSNELFVCVLGSKFHFQTCLGWILLLCGLPSLASKCQRSGYLDPSSPEILSAPAESLENALNLVVLPWLSRSGMMGGHLALELQRFKQAPISCTRRVSLFLDVSSVWHRGLDIGWGGLNVWLLQQEPLKEA